MKLTIIRENWQFIIGRPGNIFYKFISVYFLSST